MSTDPNVAWSEGYEAGYAAAAQDELDRARRAHMRGQRDETILFGSPVWRLEELGVDQQDIELCRGASLTCNHSARTEAAIRRVAHASSRVMPVPATNADGVTFTASELREMAAQTSEPLKGMMLSWAGILEDREEM